MRGERHTYHVYLETNCLGLHSLIHDFEYTGTKTGVREEARSIKNRLAGIVTDLPIHIVIYDFDLEEYV